MHAVRCKKRAGTKDTLREFRTLPKVCVVKKELVRNIPCVNFGPAATKDALANFGPHSV